jgi:aryl-alcohol dehydrogenase-like predicted oxidoreductase
MRYRPFGATGKAVSAVSLLMREAPNMNTPQAWRALAFSAMESGINSFEVTAGLDVMALGVGEALRAVERRLIFLSWRLRGDPHRPLTAEAVSNSVKAGLQKTGAGYFDLLMLDDAAYDSLEPEALGYIADLRAAGLVLQLGVTGDGAATRACIATGDFDVLATPFNLTSDWQARRHIREASAANMTIVATDPFPSALRLPTSQPQKGGLFKRNDNPLAGAGTYAFLHETPGWSSEELCLAYVLTEPAFASVQLEAFRADTIDRLAAVTDRDLPTGVAAQIEMARFSTDTDGRRRA